MYTVTIYHNPNCGTSRNVLALIRNAGIEPHIIEYLKTPPSESDLRGLLAASGLSARSALRTNVPEFQAFQLDDDTLSEEAVIAAMLQAPILINRPFVVTPLGTALCRPSEKVLDILPSPQQGVFFKEDGEPVIDANGQRIKHL